MKDLTGYPLEPVKLPQNAGALLADDLQKWINADQHAHVTAINPGRSYTWTFSEGDGSYSQKHHRENGSTSAVTPKVTYGHAGHSKTNENHPQKYFTQTACNTELPIYCLGWGAVTAPTPVTSSAIPW